MKAPTNYHSYSLDHLGLVAGLYDELEIGSHLDELIAQDLNQRHISIGTAVKAMILNGLGFANHALYLVPHFFQDKPVEHLLGQGIEAEQLNDDMLGRVLDKLYENDVTALYSRIAGRVVKQLGLAGKTQHLDSTSFHMDGRMNSDRPPEDTDVIHITQGYSRDHRPDLNQVSLQLIVESEAGIPLLMRSLSGNSVDTKTFNETLKNHVNQLDTDVRVTYLVGDAALYTKTNLQEMVDYYWVSRVPERLKSAQEMIHLFAEELAATGQDKATVCVESHYAGIPQRWLVIYTTASHERAIQTVNNQLSKEIMAREKALVKLGKEKFTCEEDAKKALTQFSEQLNLVEMVASQIVSKPYYESSGRPRKDEQPKGFYYFVEGIFLPSESACQRLTERKSCFILATNQMNCNELSEQGIIDTYKDQQKVERGFRFLKDPLFHASTLFLKSAKRIMALMMIMTLCLLVYSALEHRIRKALKESNEEFPNQQGKLIKNPTARWVFQFFTGIHLLRGQETQMIILNLNEYHRILIDLLGERYQLFYSNG
jgi:transposase